MILLCRSGRTGSRRRGPTTFAGPGHRASHGRQPGFEARAGCGSQDRGAAPGGCGKFDLSSPPVLSQRDIVPTINCTPTCYDPFAYTTTNGTASAGLSRQLEARALLGLSLSAQHTSGSFSPDNSPEPITGTAAGAAWPTLTDYYQANLTLSFSHPLWRGFGTEIALADLRRARIQQDIAELARQMRACNVVRDVAIAYWELAYATQALAIRRSAVELAEEQLRITLP